MSEDIVEYPTFETVESKNLKDLVGKSFVIRKFELRPSKYDQYALIWANDKKGNDLGAFHTTSNVIMKQLVNKVKQYTDKGKAVMVTLKLLQSTSSSYKYLTF